MVYSKNLLEQIAKALANTNEKTISFYDRNKKQVIEIKGGKHTAELETIDLVKIEPMIDDLLELMEDFSLEQDSEDVQKQLYNVLQSKNKRTNAINFKRVLHGYSRSKKRWEKLEHKWLKERAVEFLEDIIK